MSSNKYEVDKNSARNPYSSLKNANDAEKQWSKRMENVSQVSQQKSTIGGGSMAGKKLNAAEEEYADIEAKKKEKLTTEIEDWRPYDRARKTELMGPSNNHHNNNNNNNNNNNGTNPFNRFGSPGITRTRSVREIRARNHSWAKRIFYILSSQYYMTFSVILTMIALFGHDFTQAFLPKEADDATAIILCIIFGVFIIEMLLSIAVKENYFLSFSFWIDLIGTLSLLFDISFILNSFWNVESLSVQREGIEGRVSKSVSVIRITKFARILRVLRLIRVVRIFKFHGDLKRLSQPSKVGLHLTELIDKRVVFMLLGLLVVLPFFIIENRDDASASLALDIIDDAKNSVERSILIQRFQQFHPDLLYLYSVAPSGAASNDYLFEDHDQAQGLRSYEIVKFQSVNSTCALSIRESIFEESMYNMALTVFIIIMFGVGTFIISKDVNTLVVAPLERMSTLIKKLAGTICFLSSNNEEEQKELVEGYETNVIESIIEKMAQIFSVQPDNTGTSKPLQMMAGSKHTEIRTLNSVLSIEVVERPRELSPEFDDDDDDRKSKRDRIPVDLETYKELSTLETILYNPSVLPHFRMYLTSNLLLENLLFWQEVDRFRTIMRLHTLHLFNSFISHKSVHQINIPATQREKIRLQLDDPKASIFDESQNECLLLMQGHWKPFLDSKYCQAYLRSRMRHMQLRGLVGASALIKTMPKLAALKGHNEDKKSTIHRASVNHSALTQNDLATDRHQRELDRERELALAPTPQLPNSTLASKQNATKNDDGKASAITHSTPAQDNPMPFSQEQTAVMPIVDGSTAIENFPLLTNNQPRSEAFLPSDHLASSSLSSSYTQQHPNGQAAFPELTNDPTMFPPSNLPLSAAHHHTMMAGVVNNVDVTPEAVQAAAHESAMAHIPSHQTMQTGEGVINGPGEAGSADEALYYQQQQFVMMYQAAQQGMLVDANGRVITVDELVTIMHSYGYSIQAMTGIEMHPVIIDQNHPSHTSSDEVRMDVKDDGDFMSAPTDTSMAGRSPLRGRRKTPPTDSSPVLVPLSLPFNEMIDFDAQTDQYSSTNTTTPLPGTLNPDHSF